MPGASASCYRLTENTALESIKVICSWESRYRDMMKSVISNLIGSICSPHLQSVSVKLVGRAEEVEHFPWGIVNSLTRVSPYTLQKVEVALKLLVSTDGKRGVASLYPHSKYESYFCLVRLALPELDKKLIMSVAVRHPSQLFANLTSLCSTLSREDISDVRKWSLIITRAPLTLFQSWSPPESIEPGYSPATT